MEPALVREILAWPLANSGCELAALITHLTRQVNEPLSESRVRGALTWMSARGLVRVDGNALRLSEPDRPERELYESLGRHFSRTPFLEVLGIAPGTCVFQDTSSGGRTGHGPLSKPDFTLVAIKARRFERPLEVTTIEVKNRSGANVGSVYEVVGHARVSHFPFLACPRSKLDCRNIESIRTACKNEGVGLILFDIEQDGDSFSTKKVAVDTRPARRAPDTAAVEIYLAGRLTDANCAKLEALVREA